MTTTDVERAIEIVTRWKHAAKARQKKDAEADAAHVEKVLRELTGK